MAADGVVYQQPLYAPFNVTQSWGHLESPGHYHAGTDYQKPGGNAANDGQPFCCVADGVVRVAMTTKDPNWGYYVIIEHPDGVYSFYAHMITASGLQVGSSISRGDQVSTIGNWVNGGPGAYHLHLGMSYSQSGVFAYSTTFDPQILVGSSAPPLQEDAALMAESAITLVHATDTGNVYRILANNTKVLVTYPALQT